MLSDKQPLFRFVQDGGMAAVDGDYLVYNVPVEVSDPREFLRRYADGLHFPDYFGGNWNAFDECVNDLAWISNKGIVLRHRDIPHIGPIDLRIYLNILSAAIAESRLSGRCIIEVEFPMDDRKAIQNLLQKGIEDITNPQ